MTLLSLVHYLGANWRAFVSVSGLGVALGAFLTPWILGKALVRDSLVSQSPTFYLGIIALTVAALVSAWPRTVEFWRRYRRTQALDHPPIQHADLIASGIFACIITGFIIIQTNPNRPDISNPAYITVVFSLFLFFLWLISSWAWSHKQSTDSDLPIPVGRHDGDYADDPITTDDQDLLGRVPFVDRLLGQILNLPSPNSFVFGLYGSWGEGKTSVLKLLQIRLAKNPNVITVAFNPWYFADEAALVQAFYSSIEQELGRLYILSGLHRTITQYKNLLTSGLRYLGIQFPVKDDPERLRSELESWVQRIGCRLVIIIDDIDRLQSDEMLAVLKLPRLSAKLQNTAFLLSLDHLIVIEILQESAGLEPEFLDKIIQKSVPLPPAEQGDIDRFLFFSDPQGPEAHRSAIDRLLDDLEVEPRRRKDFDDKMSYFYRTAIRRLFGTIRHAKRYLNTLRATLPPIAHEVNLYDFFLLEALQVFFPKIYKDIWSSPWFYLPAWAQEIFLVRPFGHVSDHDEKYRLIREHIEDLLSTEREREIAQEILKELFFEVENALKPHGRMQHDNMAETYLADKKLTHPKCFPRYFLFRIPAGEFADELVEKLIESWNSVSDPENAVYGDLREYREAGQVVALLEKLRVFRKLISPARVPTIVRALCRIVPDMSAVGPDPWSSEIESAEHFLLSLVEDRADAQEIEPIIQEVVLTAPSFPFVAGLVYECGRRGSGSYFRIYEKVNITSLRKLASDRLSEHFIQGNRDIFDELSGRDLPLVLYQWATNWRTDSEDNRLIVQNYVMTLVDRKPECLGRLLSEFRSRSLSGEYLTFDYEGFRRAFDPAFIQERLERYGEAAIITTEAKEAAKLFREQYDAHKTGQEQPEKA